MPAIRALLAIGMAFCSVPGVPEVITVGRVVKALDSQPRDRRFESLHTLNLLCLESWAGP